MNRLLMVIGAQGSGKTSTSRHLVENYGFSPIFNEDLWVSYQKRNPGTVAVESKKLTDSLYQEAEFLIRNKIKESDVVYEATGAKPQWQQLYQRLSDLEPVVVIVQCSFEVALHRHRTEDKTGKNVAEPRNHAEELYKMLINSGVRPDFTIDNSRDFRSTGIYINKMMAELGIPKLP